MPPNATLGLPDAHWRARALAFNLQPAGYLHASWSGQLPFGECLTKLSAAPRACPVLSTYLLETLDLLGRYVEDFSNPWARLALLDGPWLERLLRRLGLALCSANLRRELSGKCVRRLKATFGAEEWRFVVREAPLLGQIPPWATALWTPDGELSGDIGGIGAAFCAHQGLAAQEVALTRRLTLKLPAVWAATLESESDRSPCGAELPPLLRKLLHESPAWSPLFA